MVELHKLVFFLLSTSDLALLNSNFAIGPMTDSEQQEKSILTEMAKTQSPKKKRDSHQRTKQRIERSRNKFDIKYFSWRRDQTKSIRRNKLAHNGTQESKRERER
jgi:hypothetical protein